MSRMAAMVRVLPDIIDEALTSSFGRRSRAARRFSASSRAMTIPSSLSRNALATARAALAASATRLSSSRARRRSIISSSYAIRLRTATAGRWHMYPIAGGRQRGTQAQRRNLAAGARRTMGPAASRKANSAC